MIVILNGASSSGKTALARALQLEWPRPLLHLGTDSMLAMLPPACVGMKPTAAEGVEFYADRDEHGPVVRVRSGKLGRRVEQSFARALRLYVDEGHDVVLDLVLFDSKALASYVAALLGQRTYFVGVCCELAVLEARELARGDRFQNLARAQLSDVHAYREFYDLEVDTSSLGPRELAASIMAFVESHPSPSSFERLSERFSTEAKSA